MVTLFFNAYEEKEDKDFKNCQINGINSVPFNL